MGSRNQSLEEAVIAVNGRDGVTQLLDKVNRSQDALLASQQRSTRVASEQADATRGLATAWESLTDRISSFQRAVGIIAAGELIEWAGRLGSAIGEAASVAARAEAVGADFARRFGDAAGAMERLRAATAGTVADSALQALATQGARAGLSIEQISRLMEGSARAAIGTGREVEEVASAVLKSTVEANDEALKQLGIVVDLDGAFASYAASIGTTTTALSAQQRTAAALEQNVRALGAQFAPVTGAEASANLQKVSAWWQDTKESAAGAAVAVAEFGVAVASIPEQLRQSESVTSADRWRAEWEQQVADRRAAAAEAAALWRGEQAPIRDTRAELTKYLEALGQTASAEHERAAAADRAAAAVAAEIAANRQALDAARERVMAIGREVEATEAAKLAEVNRTAALAAMATELGFVAQATERWSTALSAAEAAGLDMTRSVDLLAAAARASNDEFARTLEIQAQMAEASGDAAQAAALRSQLIGRLEGGSADGRSPVADRTPRGGGRRAPSGPDDAARERDKWRQAELDARDQVAANMAALERERQHAEYERAIADAQQRLEEVKAAQAAARQAEFERSAAGMDSVRSAAAALGDQLGTLGGIDLSGLGAAADQLGPLIENIELLNSASGQSRDGMIKSTQGIIQASGKVAAAFAKDQKSQAIIAAIMETAAGIASAAMYDYGGAAMHFLSAATYGIVAGTSGGGRGAGAGGGGAAARRRDPGSALGTPAPTAPAASVVSYNTYITAGAVLGPNEQESARGIVRLLGDETRRRSGAGYGYAPQ